MARRRVDVQYTRGRSQDLRDVTAKIRAIELFNPDGLSPPLLCPASVPFVSHPRFPPACLPTSSPFILRRSPFTPSPSNSPSSLLPLSLVPLRSLFFSVAAYFFCLASLALARAPLYLFHPPPSPPPASLARSLFCHGALVLALSHSICHPPSFHHPSKPWSLTGDTDIHIHRYT